MKIQFIYFIRKMSEIFIKIENFTSRNINFFLLKKNYIYTQFFLKNIFKKLIFIVCIKQCTQHYYFIVSRVLNVLQQQNKTETKTFHLTIFPKGHKM